MCNFGQEKIPELHLFTPFHARSGVDRRPGHLWPCDVFRQALQRLLPDFRIGIFMGDWADQFRALNILGGARMRTSALVSPWGSKYPRHDFKKN